ncbi:MAG: hypothetical protein IJF33_07635 [Clostridia bacterium]|nr:hypothetical protein [Clostridia bacterium]
MEVGWEFAQPTSALLCFSPRFFVHLYKKATVRRKELTKQTLFGTMEMGQSPKK